MQEEYLGFCSISALWLRGWPARVPGLMLLCEPTCAGHRGVDGRAPDVIWCRRELFPEPLILMVRGTPRTGEWPRKHAPGGRYLVIPRLGLLYGRTCRDFDQPASITEVSDANSGARRKIFFRVPSQPCLAIRARLPASRRLHGSGLHSWSSSRLAKAFAHSTPPVVKGG